jgi:hypothetical protein
MLKPQPKVVSATVHSTDQWRQLSGIAIPRYNGEDMSPKRDNIEFSCRPESNAQEPVRRTACYPTGCIQADNCNDLLGSLFIPAFLNQFSQIQPVSYFIGSNQ